MRSSLRVERLGLSVSAVLAVPYVPETVAAMQAMQLSRDGSPLGYGLSWWIGKDDFGDHVHHTGSGAGSESTMRLYPDLNLGVVVMSNVTGYQRDRLVEGLVSAWTNEK